MPAVPPLIAVTLGVIGAAFAVKYFAKPWRRAETDHDRTKTAPVDSNGEAVPKLRRDPVTGIYHP